MTGEPLGRSTLARAFARATLGFDLATRVARALPPRPPSRARVRLIAVGKAAPEMARGALSVWTTRVERALVVAPDDTPFDLGDANVELLRAAHPLPDARSVVAAGRALELAVGEAKDLLLVLVSGGASALLCQPIAGLALEDKIDVTRTLLASGASIEAINVVRRHMSRIKGGGLTRAAAPGRVLALLASDVIGGLAHDVGSGPTVSDPTTVADARVALAQWAPSFASLPMGETLEKGEAAARRQRAKVVATPDELARAVAKDLSEEEGLCCRVLPPTTLGAVELDHAYEGMSESLDRGCAVVRAAEAPVTVSAPPGRGGRAGHIAALVGLWVREGHAFLAGASDGIDGSSGAAGAVVDASFRQLGVARIREALEAFDTARLHEDAGTAIRLGPTGKNFADVHVLCRLR